jgi:hypothetical protein
MRSESMSKPLVRARPAIAVKIVIAFALAAASVVVATQVAITGSANPAGWGRQVNHKVTVAPAIGPAASAQQPAGSVTGHSEKSVTAGGAGGSAPSGVTTNWFTEPNDPPYVAAQTKFVPKP